MPNICKISIKILKIVFVHAVMVAKDGEEKNAIFDMLIFIREYRVEIPSALANRKRRCTGGVGTFWVC